MRRCSPANFPIPWRSRCPAASVPPSRSPCTNSATGFARAGRDQGRRRRSRRHPWRAGDRDGRPGAPGAGRRVSRRRGGRHGHAPRPAAAAGEPAINPAPRAMIRAQSSPRRLADARGRDLDPRRREDRRTHAQRPARHCRRPVDPRHDGDRRAVFLRAPGSTRSIAASTSRAPRGSTHIAGATGSTSEAAVQRLHGLPEIALIDMGDFVGGMLKYLRAPPGRRRDHRRRLRQDEQARRRGCSTCIRGAARLISTGSPRRASRSRRGRRCDCHRAANTAKHAFDLARPPASTSPRPSPKPPGRPPRRPVGAGAQRLEIAVFDRDGVVAGDDGIARASRHRPR